MAVEMAAEETTACYCACVGLKTARSRVAAGAANQGCTKGGVG